MSPIITSLVITVIGMGLVFIAILLLWGLMELVMRFTAQPEEAKEEEVGEELAESEAPIKSGLKLRAAATAVAYAISVRRSEGFSTGTGAPAASSEMTSAWQAAGRASAISQRTRMEGRR